MFVVIVLLFVRLRFYGDDEKEWIIIINVFLRVFVSIDWSSSVQY